MSKMINISDKLDNTKPKIQIGEKEYEVNDSMSVVMKFEELSVASTSESMMAAMELTLGKKAAEELDIANWSIKNFKIMITAILAAMQGMTYEEAESKFPKQG